MQKTAFCSWPARRGNRYIAKKLLVMKLTTVLLFSTAFLQVSAIGVSQTVNFSGQHVHLSRVFEAVESQTGFVFFYNEAVLKNSRLVTVKAVNMLLPDFLTLILKDQPLKYSIQSRTITISRKQAPPPAFKNAAPEPVAEILAPPIDVRGKIFNEMGDPVAGASVLIKGTSRGTVSDTDGGFLLRNVEEDAILVIAGANFQQIEWRVDGKADLAITVQTVVNPLDEVVVIGYGTLRKSDLTGAVGSVREKQLKERPATSLNQALAGRIAGVQVNTNSGRPGGQTSVRIRGFSSINSTNNPLYVVDGVMLPVSNQGLYSTAIDFINPNDIEAVEVLKDASATAIYGARGANGVILITTKRGKSGDGRITYDVDLSVPTVAPNRAEVLNAKEFLAMEDLGYRNMEKYDPAGWASGKYAFRDPALARTDPRLFDSEGNPLYDTDWMKEATQNRISQNHQLGFNGGNGRNTYSFSLGYRDEQGLLLHSYLKRYSAGFNYDDQIKKWLKVGGSVRYSSQRERIVNHGESTDTPERLIYQALPFLPVKFPDGSWADWEVYPNLSSKPNPVHYLDGRKYFLNTDMLIGNAYSTISLAKGLEMRTVLGVNMLSLEDNQYNDRTIARTERGIASVSNRKETFWSLENYLTYNKRVNDHSFTGLLGASWQETNSFSMGASIRNFSTDYLEFNNLGAGSQNPGYNSSRFRYAFNSYFGRANYNFKDKYLLTLTGRTDGSSKFGQEHKYAFFPSAAVAWRISEEAFWENNTAISNFKIRASYGITGNSEIPPYSSLSLLSSSYAAVINNARVGGTGISRLANHGLKWEKTAQSDVGIELALFNNRISIEADYYYRKTTDMLLDAPVPRTSGYTTIRRNIGSMENKGFEFSVNSLNINTRDFSWNTVFNISLNRNKVLSLATPSDIFGVGGPNFTNQTNIIRVGEPVGSFWGLVRLGTWSEAEREEATKFASYRNGLTMLPGDVKYLDVNGDYAINDADRMIIGNGNPKGWGAFLNSFRYKNFDVTIELQYSYGNDILDMTTHSQEDRQLFNNSYKTVLNAWTPENQHTPIAEIRDNRAGHVTQVDTHWLQDGSFVRGKNLLLSYSFGPAVTDRLHLSRLRIYGSVQNFFLITEFNRNDPEVTSYGNSPFAQGQFFFNYPRPRTYMLGLNVGL